MRFHMRPFTMFLNQVKTLVLQIEKDVRWVGRYTAGHGPDTGKTIYPNVLGRTQAEVREKLKAAIGEAQGLDAAKTGKYTVGQWMDVWYENYAKIKVLGVLLEPPDRRAVPAGRPDQRRHHR